jgi:hypothetical protein
MTLPSSGRIDVGDINVEIGRARTFSTNLSFLNNQIVPTQRPATPVMSQFYSKNFFQNNTQGNCNNGNCTSNCNCGNIQCNNCLIGGTVNCTNCDAQSWLQTNCNCACTYNCTTSQTSYNCNCACNCSKIICAKLYEFGLMDPNIWAADQKYGQWLRKNDRSLYRGYVRWARIVTAWMDGKGPDFMVWIKDDTKRSIAQKAAITDMAIKIGTPWSEHMAWLMNEVKNDNTMGRILMAIGTPISKLVSLLPRSKKKFANRKHSLITLYTMWALFYFSYYTSLNIVKIMNIVDKFKKIKIFSIFKESK